MLVWRSAKIRVSTGATVCLHLELDIRHLEQRDHADAKEEQVKLWNSPAQMVIIPSTLALFHACTIEERVVKEKPAF